MKYDGRAGRSLFFEQELLGRVSGVDAAREIHICYNWYIYSLSNVIIQNTNAYMKF